MRRFFSGLAVLAIARLVAGCGGLPSFDDYCKAREACLGGNQADVSACVDEQKLEGTIAGDEGCSEEFKAFANCVIGASACRNVDLGVPCKMDADCGGKAEVVCQTTCHAKSYGLDPMMPATCEKESNAYNKCKSL